MLKFYENPTLFIAIISVLSLAALFFVFKIVKAKVLSKKFLFALPVLLSMAFIAATVYIGFKFNYESPQEAIVISSLSSDSQFNFPYKINRFERISNVELFSVENKGQFIQAIKNHEDFLFEYNNVYVFRKNFDYYSITYDKREKGVDVFYAKTETFP